MNVLKRLTELTKLTKSELAKEAGLEGRIYNLFECELPEAQRETLRGIVAELEKIYVGRKFSRIVFDAIKRKVETRHEPTVSPH